MFNKFENYLKINVDSEETIKIYINRISQFFKYYRKFEQTEINNYLTKIIDTKKSASTFNVTLASFRKYAMFKNKEIKLPKQKKTNNILRTTLSRDEIENDILPYFKLLFRDSNKRKLIFRFLMLTLMRISEVSKLKKEDFDFKTNQIRIIDGKGSKSRITFINKTLINDLKEEFSKTNTESAFNISTSYIRYIFKQINTMLNYHKQITAHTLRHAGAKYMYNNGMSLKALKEILGHESLDTTDRYLNFTIDEIQNEYNKINYKKG